MKITINKNEFLYKLSIACKFTLSKISSIPTLQGGLLKHEKNTLFIHSTNLKDSFSSFIKTKQEAKFEAVVDIKKITEFLNLITEEEVDITFHQKYLEIDGKNSSGTFDFVSAKDFPTESKIKGQEYLFGKEGFLNLCSYVLFSSSEDESRPVLSGIKLIFDQKETIMVSTDGFRLSLVHFPAKNKQSETIIAANVFREAVRLVKDKNTKLVISESKPSAMFDLGDMSIYTQVIEGEFPPYEKVIPKTHTTKITIEKTEFLRNLKLASVFARDYSNVVVLDIRDKNLFIIPKTTDGKKSRMVQDVQISGDPLIIAFNIKFLVDFLNSVPGESIEIGFTTPNSPALFLSKKEKNFLHVIMPVRTDEPLS